MAPDTWKTLGAPGIWRASEEECDSTDPLRFFSLFKELSLAFQSVFSLEVCPSFHIYEDKVIYLFYRKSWLFGLLPLPVPWGCSPLRTFSFYWLQSQGTYSLTLMAPRTRQSKGVPWVAITKIRMHEEGITFLEILASWNMIEKEHKNSVPTKARQKETTKVVPANLSLQYPRRPLDMC